MAVKFRAKRRPRSRLISNNVAGQLPTSFAGDDDDIQGSPSTRPRHDVPSFVVSQHGDDGNGAAFGDVPIIITSPPPSQSLDAALGREVDFEDAV